MSILILHLSDIHIKSDKDPILKMGKDIASCTYSSIPIVDHIFIIISGDIAFSGEKVQYDLATEFLTVIKQTIEHETDIPINFIIVPGNHDCNFNNGNSTRNILLDNLEENDNHIDSSIIENCTSIQADFFNFREKLEGDKNVVDDDLLWRSSKFDVKGEVFYFECLNISWVSRLQESPGKLYFPIDKYSNKTAEESGVSVMVLHHPLNWFSQSNYRPFRTFVRKHSDIIITGHEHQGNVGVINDSETEKSVFIEGCVLQEGSTLSDSSFNVVIINTNKKEFKSTKHNWSGSRYEQSEEGSWLDFHELPIRQKNAINISDSFQEILDDPGGFFKHPGKTNIKLSDIFIYPDLKNLTESNALTRSTINSSILIDSKNTANGVLITGDEKSGATSLLYKLYQEYYDQGFIPVFLKGRDFKKGTEIEINKVIDKAVVNQYGKANTSFFQQTSCKKKILLVDNFDETKIKAKDKRTSLLEGLRKRFGHFVVTVNDMFEITEILEGDISSELLSLNQYEIQAFGYVRREELIKTWFSIGNDVTEDESTFIGKCDQAERLINSVMTQLIIPSVPFYLLTLLQSIEAGRTGDFKESALGYYYQFHLTEAFQSVGIKADKLTEIFQYTSHLAWEFHYQGLKSLSKGDLIEFNKKFSEDWHTTDLFSTLEKLIKAKIIFKTGEEYSFRYPYLYFYLKGMYISNNLEDTVIRDYVIHCCKHLYVREHANTVLFLVHHTNDSFVINSIADTLHEQFIEFSPNVFNGSSSIINKLINDLPLLQYSKEKPLEYRKRNNAILDEFDERDDGLSDNEEESSELSLIAQLTVLFKTTEILGEVLKNQYARIKRDRKNELLTELFNGPLRALHCFLDFFSDSPESLVNELESAIKRKNISTEKESKELAKKIAANIIQFMGFTFIMKASQGAKSEDLSENINTVVKDNKSIEFKFIELCILLDSPKPIPQKKLEALSLELKNNILGQRILKLMILNRLYMFKSTETDLQWLGSKMDLDIAVQHRISYVNKKLHRLK